MSQFEYSNQCEESNETFSCFASLSEEQKRYLEDNKNEVVYYKGETIIKQGTTNNSVMYLNEGLVKLSMQSNDKYVIMQARFV